MAKEIRSFWDVSSLTEYISLEQIPRGLRIKTFLTSGLFDDNLKKEWTDTVSACSLKLMDIIISLQKKELDLLQAEMSIIQKDLSTLQNHNGFSELDGRLNIKLDKMEKNVIENKKCKMTRDRIDYESYNIYIWRKLFFFWSIAQGAC